MLRATKRKTLMLITQVTHSDQFPLFFGPPLRLEPETLQLPAQSTTDRGPATLPSTLYCILMEMWMQGHKWESQAGPTHVSNTENCIVLQIE